MVEFLFEPFCFLVQELPRYLWQSAAALPGSDQAHVGSVYAGSGQPTGEFLMLSSFVFTRVHKWHRVTNSGFPLALKS